MRKKDDSKKSAIVEYINEYYSDFGQTPTVRAISEGTGIAVATVHRYGYEMIDTPQRDILDPEGFERLKNRVYFVCNDYRNLDDEGKFYLHKSIVNLKVNQSAQNPISYLAPTK